MHIYIHTDTYVVYKAGGTSLAGAAMPCFQARRASFSPSSMFCTGLTD